MRIPTLILYLLLCVVSAYAKDVITKTDGSTIDAKVEEITESVIKYRKASNTTGPVYTIPIASVATILYENGTTDTFNSPVATTTVPVAQTASPSDEELMQLAESTTSNNSSGYVSDRELLKIYSDRVPEDLKPKVSMYRKIGWIGGGVLFAVGLAAGISVYAGDWHDWGVTWLGVGTVSAAIWCLGFNLKANSLVNQAKKAQSYSATIFENKLTQFNNNTLTAGLNVMGNHLTYSHSIGVSLGLNF